MFMTRLFSILLIFPGFILIIVGCANFQNQELNPVESMTHLENRTLSNPEL